MKKVRVHITKTTVNAPTYSNVTFEPTLINFFYQSYMPLPIQHFLNFFPLPQGHSSFLSGFLTTGCPASLFNLSIYLFNSGRFS